MASKTEGANRYYYRGDEVVYPYLSGTPSSERLLAYLSDPENFHVAQSKLASTVMLLREGEGENAVEPQVFMLHRVSSMAFAADAYVFPGGAVDTSDGDESMPWAGPSAAQWAARLQVDERTAISVVVAAARELYEECGVLLASSDDGAVGVVPDERMHREREALSSHRTSLAEVLRERDMVLRTDLLSARARWITPVAEPHRYDTFFFAAVLPMGVQADGRTSEASESRWITPSRILQQFDNDETLLLPPTIFNLQKLQAARSISSFLSNRPDMGAVLCRSDIIDGQAVAICPKA
ncbi:MAG: NUDIX hydrolase [Eggerthellaceae bacterium]|nr:NUDIX hydrolase [Eggerthellaceae bacterium]